MEWTLLTRNQYVTTAWSGGTTTQLAIAPEGAVYADRDFIWRLSAAGVEMEHSEFTPLPDYLRLISIQNGNLELKIGDGGRFPLEPLTVCSFDGGTPVESWGRCTDFNLMLRKGHCHGTLQSLTLEPGSVCAWTPPVPAPQVYPHCTLALYCVSGAICLDTAHTAQAGQLLLCRDADDRTPLRLSSQTGGRGLMAVIYS